MTLPVIHARLVPKWHTSRDIRRWCVLQVFCTDLLDTQNMPQVLCRLALLYHSALRTALTILSLLGQVELSSSCVMALGGLCSQAGLSLLPKVLNYTVHTLAE